MSRSVLALTLLTGLSLALGGPAPAHPHPGTAIKRALAAQGPIVSDADNALIASKCGLAPGSKRDRSVTFTNGALHCGNGRVVRDAETDALSDRIGTRANAHVRTVMSDPAVRSAIDTYASAKARAALRRAGLDRD